MSSISIPTNSHNVKCRRKFDRFATPEPSAIPFLWRELSALTDVAPDGERPGLARARTRLLDNVPSWMLPAFLDDLAATSEFSYA